MPKRKIPGRDLEQRGMTLIEVMISTGLAGIIMVALMFLLGKAGDFASLFQGQAVTIEGVTEAVDMFHTVLTQTTRIQNCLCHANADTKAGCVWDASNPWHDPVLAGGATSPATLLRGEYEAYDGSQSLTSMSNLTTGNITIPGGTCATQASNMASGLLRGCKLPYTLVYTAPTASSGSTPSNAGQLTLNMGASKSVSLGRAASTGAGGLGVTEVSCGFETGNAGTSGAIFVLNIKIKARSTTSVTPTAARYESWYPDATCSNNYCKGNFREVRMKFAMRNILTRGAYYWRPVSITGCKTNTAATKVGECCSQAWDGSTCLAACVPAGTGAGTAEACCSGKQTSGVCQ